MYFAFQILIAFQIGNILSIFLGQCGSNDSIFLSSKQDIQTERMYGKTGWNETSNQQDEITCRALCHFEEKCRSAIFNLQDQSCLLQDFNRFSSNIKIKLAPGYKYYDKGTCQVASTRAAFIGLVENAVDCKDIKEKGWQTNGVYGVPIVGENNTYQTISCEMSLLGGGWTVIQRRTDGSVSFDKTWIRYKQGFGNHVGNLWYGNERIHKLTWWNNNDILFELHLLDGRQFYPMYDEFKVGDEASDYTLTVGNRVETDYGDTADYNRYQNFEYQNQKRFSTKDRKTSSCSDKYSGGWWFNNCYKVYLNGIYGENSNHGICWDSITHSSDGSIVSSFIYTTMMIRKK